MNTQQEKKLIQAFETSWFKRTGKFPHKNSKGNYEPYSISLAFWAFKEGAQWEKLLKTTQTEKEQ